MASRPKRPCRYPRCPALVESGYCEEHSSEAKRYDKERGSASARGYGKAWQHLRKEILLRDSYTCQDCGCFVGMRKGDAHVDHITSKDRGGTDDESNLQTLCESCHSRKTVLEDGGFGTSGTQRRA